MVAACRPFQPNSWPVAGPSELIALVASGGLALCGMTGTRKLWVPTSRRGPGNADTVEDYCQSVEALGEIVGVHRFV